MVTSSTSSGSMALTSSSSTSKTYENGMSSATNGTVDNNCNNNENIALKTFPKGKYTLVAIDIDTTGRRLIDEIVQLAAFTPKDHFEQYIMPYMNLNPAARQRHQVRVISIGFYRMLKSMQTFKIIKSKSEIAALKNFLDWLEALKSKDESSQGIILLYHEERKFIPYMILESLRKYNLLDRFLNTVKSFANGINLAKSKENGSLKRFTLRKLSKHLKISNVEKNNIVGSSTMSGIGGADTISEQKTEKQKSSKASSNEKRNLFEGNASFRAKLAYEVALYLSNQDSKVSLDSINAIDKMFIELEPFIHPIKCDLNELQTQNENLERQNSFRPIFLNYFKATLYHRVRAVRFRIILAEYNYDLQSLKTIWSEKKRDGIVGILQTIDELKTEEKTELTDLFDSYFDPAKKTIKPVVVNNNNNHRRNRSIRKLRSSRVKIARFAAGNKIGGGEDKQQNGVNGTNLPDSTTKSPKKQSGKRQKRSYNKDLFKTQNMLPSDDQALSVVENEFNNTVSAPEAIA